MVVKRTFPIDPSGVFRGAGIFDRRDIPMRLPSRQITVGRAPVFPRREMPSVPARTVERRAPIVTIPVGTTRAAVLGPRTQLPSVVPTVTTRETVPILRPPVRPRTVPVQTVAKPIPQPIGVSDMPIHADLGMILRDVAVASIQGRAAPQIIQAGAPSFFPTQTFTPSLTPALNIPFVDVIPEVGAGGCAPLKGMVWNPSANCGAGKWQKRSRRRRKRLATMGDLKDLAALKGVLGGGKAFEVWIATHS